MTTSLNDRMREIKFRGKTVNGQWVIGGYTKRGGKHYIIRDIDEPAIPVIPETIGQFTGLKDKNGKEIFEGDKVTADDEIYDVIFNERFGAFELRYTGNTVAFYLRRDIEIIGNIHENK